MKVEYLPSFIKDLKSLRSTSVYEPIRALVFEVIPGYENFQEILQIKKLKNGDQAYRLRVGDYRIGFTFEQGVITFARVLHRKEIYRYFP
jgi:mRNA interferase RelE/StbE